MAEKEPKPFVCCDMPMRVNNNPNAGRGGSLKFTVRCTKCGRWFETGAPISWLATYDD